MGIQNLPWSPAAVHTFLQLPLSLLSPFLAHFLLLLLPPFIGSSAGGHLASTLLTHFDGGKSDSTDPFERESSRPDLGVLCYPVISLGEFAHAGSRKNLLGDNPAPELLQNLSNQFQVTKDTPPTFIWHTVADKTVPVENSLMFAAALRQAGVPFSLHIYETGAHGLGLGGTRGQAPPWAAQLLYWLGERKFIK